MESYPCRNNNVYLIDDDVVDAYGSSLAVGSIDMRFMYAAEGREVGEIIRQDIWFEKRRVRKDRKNPNFIDQPVMVTSLTVRQRADPFNGEADRQDLELGTVLPGEVIVD
eukprot:6472968-Amphidinium_carterae.2